MNTENEYCASSQNLSFHLFLRICSHRCLGGLSRARLSIVMSTVGDASRGNRSELVVVVRDTIPTLVFLKAVRFLYSRKLAKRTVFGAGCDSLVNEKVESSLERTKINSKLSWSGLSRFLERLKYFVSTRCSFRLSCTHLGRPISVPSERQRATRTLSPPFSF
jgi:hypothetical protein